MKYFDEKLAQELGFPPSFFENPRWWAAVGYRNGWGEIPESPMDFLSHRERMIEDSVESIRESAMFSTAKRTGDDAFNDRVAFVWAKVRGGYQSRYLEWVNREQWPAYPEPDADEDAALCKELATAHWLHHAELEEIDLDYSFSQTKDSIFPGMLILFRIGVPRHYSDYWGEWDCDRDDSIVYTPPRSFRWMKHKAREYHQSILEERKAKDRMKKHLRFRYERDRARLAVVTAFGRDYISHFGTIGETTYTARLCLSAIHYLQGRAHEERVIVAEIIRKDEFISLQEISDLLVAKVRERFPQISEDEIRLMIEQRGSVHWPFSYGNKSTAVERLQKEQRRFSLRQNKRAIRKKWKRED